MSAQWATRETRLPYPTREEWAARPATYAEGTAAWLGYLAAGVRSVPLRPYAEAARRNLNAPEPRR